MSELKTNKCLIVAIAVILQLLFNCVYADEPANEANLIGMDLEQLMEVQVVSASRTGQKLSETSVPVTVVTAEDIHYSGLTDIYEILKFYTSIDYLKMSRDESAIGIRGGHEAFSDRVMTLIDGKNADNFFRGGPQFELLPIFVEDIERIEIIRGPGGAAWGANAFTGVINIITKDPEKTQGVLASTTWNQFGDSWTHLRWGAKKDNLTWRISSGYENMESSEDAIDNDSFTSTDAVQNMKFNSRFEYTLSDRTKWSFGAGYLHRIKNLTTPEQWYDTIRTFAKLDHEFKNGNSGYLQFSSNYYDNRWNIRIKGWENNIDGQLNFKLNEKHNVSVGGNFKATYITDYPTYYSAGPLELRGTPDTEFLAGVFIIDRYQYSKKIWFEEQLRGDWFSQTQADWSGRAAVFFKLDEKRDGILRLAIAKAFRTPLSSLERYWVRQVGLGGGVYMINIVPNDDLKNEETWALEAGYSVKLTPKTQVKVDTYYQRFERLIGYTTTTTVFPPTRTSTSVNTGGANSYGVEVELNHKLKNGEIAPWYCYNGFSTDQVNQNTRTYEPAKNKFGIRARLNLEDGWTVNSNLRYADYSLRHSTTGIPVIVNGDFNLDFSVAKKIFDGNGELMIGISDLLSTAEEKTPSVDEASPNLTPGRTIFARLQIRF